MPVPSPPMTDTTRVPASAEGAEPEATRGCEPEATRGCEREAPGVSAREAAGDARRRRARSLIEWVVVLVVALLASLAIRGWVVQTFYIPSPSMTPTLAVQDRIVVDKIHDSLGDVDRGDIVVFARPAGAPGSIEDLVKRVIALPGEVVEGHDGQVWIDGDPLAEPWLPDDVVTSDFPATEVPDGTMWVMGDNRSNSTDSRVFGPVDAHLLVGEAVFRIWPLDRAGALWWPPCRR